MEKTGLLTKLFSDTNKEWKAFCQKEETREVKEYKKVLDIIIADLKVIKQTNDIHLLLSAENLLLTREL